METNYTLEFYKNNTVGFVSDDSWELSEDLDTDDFGQQ